MKRDLVALAVQDDKVQVIADDVGVEAAGEGNDVWVSLGPDKGVDGVEQRWW